MNMNKKGITPITIIFWVLCFVMLWFLFLGQFMNIGVSSAIENNNLTGIEAFILMNMNLLIFICLIIFIVAYSYIMGGGG